MVRTQIQIHPAQLSWLKHHAVGKGVSMSQIIRECIDLYHLHTERALSLNSKKKKALTVVGSFTSDFDAEL